MKKKLVSIICLILVVASIATITVFAFSNGDTYENMLIKQYGYTEQDIQELKAIQVLSETKASGYIVQKYNELKDWKKVREYYNVDDKKYENYIFGRKMWQQKLETIPEYILKEMKAQDWSEKERDQFVNKMSISEIDYEYAWEEYKKGKTITELIEEKRVKDKAESKLMNEFVYGEMTIFEYEKALNKISKKDKPTMEKALAEVEKLRHNMRERHKKQSGISDEEIEYCKSRGITNPMDMYQAKSISKGNNISLEKVVKAKIKNGDWSRTTAEIFNIPYDKYQMQEKINQDKE